MATTTSRPGTGQSHYSGAAAGLTAFAGVLMLLTGALHALQGIVALVNDEFFVFGEEYVFKFDVTTWGWVHLLLGLVVAAAGIALFQAATWARVVAVVLAGLSIIASFLWMPFYPFWSLMLVAFDVFVIWAVTAHGQDISRL
ncbi:MAG TPA: hypothetical protein VFR87_01025 [Nocardioidaceae bacterium]|nr:hypothetical protein [Nocardioidaceae bacterium]